MNDVSEVPVWVLVGMTILVLSQGLCLFTDARKRGLGKMAWFWGIWGSTTMPLPLVLYWFIVIRPRRKK
ncbi:hypothetical protein SAMN05661091_0700 [Paenibacillus uliginis N3/975]|uniref:Phospholipase_D-nuclease N-terminal n=1 Tax=Paenibacillus uliginis N3/975 TaxID=1313296 RepID=A0A1X7GL15_9BACL|nr:MULTISPECIES: hypothetical protein [Paenibacillus]UNK17782.1 hypothetical protein MNQ98_25650 [Paenibacillus sp. N3/727]SMF71238.1 hypothetical protein SAMN05661091_0700 [Paenibacillus uliginis N3/975]